MIAPLLLLAAMPWTDACPDQSQTGLVRCAGDLADKADDALARQWAVALGEARRQDALRGAGVPRQQQLRYAEDLLASQKAWLAYRDAECASEGNEAHGGRDGGVREQQCRARLAGARAVELRDYVDWLGQD